MNMAEWQVVHHKSNEITSPYKLRLNGNGGFPRNNSIERESERCYFFQVYNSLEPITVAARSKAWTVFARSNTGVVGSDRTQGMDVCVRLFCVYVAALLRADPPYKEPSRLCID
jgi:hypothetical protein